MTAMSPAEVMAKAAYDLHRSRWLGGDRSEWPPTWEELNEIDPDGQERSIKQMRAALRALAEMEPTEAMRNSYCLPKRTAPFWDRVQAALLAAAAEGESK